MSGSDYWLNRVGAVATASTSSGSVPAYGMAFDVGTAKWPDAQTFNNAVADMATRRRAGDIQALEAAKAQADEGFMRKLISGTGQNLIEGVGFIAGGPFQKLDENTEAANQQRGQDVLQTLGEAPVLKQMGQAWNFASNVIETPLILDRNTAMQGELGLWLDKSAWGAAWREADDRTFGQALVEALSTGEGTTQKDLDRIRRTNNLYAITTLGADLALEWKFDPTVLTLKGVGEVKKIRTGQLSAIPSGKLRDTTALRAARDPNFKYTGLDPRGKYGAWRGRQVGKRMDQVFDFAEQSPYYDVANLPMFKRRATHGAQAAYAVKIAAGDPKLRDLTKRLLLGDPKAIIEVNQLKKDPLALREYAPDAATFVDALEATKTRIKGMQDEIADLEKTIAKRGEDLSQAKNPGFFQYHTWELTRDLESKVDDLTQAQTRLAGYDDYSTWLESVMDQRSVFTNVEQINVGQVPKTFAGLSQRTYSKSPYGLRHSVLESSKAAWMRQAQPIDLHDVDTGFMSIKRQFEQMDHLFGYRLSRAEYDDAFTAFLRAKDPTERFRVAQAIEEQHLVQAISDWTKRTHPGTEGLSPDTIRMFFERVQFKRNEMAQALLSGKGAVYSTWPGDNPGAKLIDIKDGIAELQFMDNGDMVTVRVPEEALKTQNFANDPTQTPNFYQPLDAQMVKAAINREWSLFEELEGQVRLNGRKGSAWIFNHIDKYGTAWNSFWKPLQLFRLAWPQRVLMDEGFRGLAVLGVSEFARTYGSAFVAASLNAVNPAKHSFGIGKRITQRNLQRNVKIGPGPLADEITGRSIDVPAYEAVIDAAPYVPERFVPRRNPARSRVVNDFLYQSLPARRVRQRARALLRNPNRGWSLADDADTPHNWLSIDDALGNQEGRLLMGDEVPVNDPNGLMVARTDPEEFTSSDFDFAAKGYELTDEDVIAQLSGINESDVSLIDRFLNLPDEVRAAIWNGEVGKRTPVSSTAKSRDVVLQGDMNRMAVADFGSAADDFAPGGRLRPMVREAVKKGKKLYAEELAARQTGAGRKPVFSGVFTDLGGPQANLELRMAKELGADWFPVSSGLESFSSPRIRRAVKRADLFEQFDHPIYKEIARARWDATEQVAHGSQNVTRVFDHTSGRITKKGYAVRVAEAELPTGTTNHPMMGLSPDDLDVVDDLVSRNEDFLASTNYRMMIEAGEGTGRVSIVRYFPETERSAAIDFGRYMGAKSVRRLRGNAPKTRTGNFVDDAYPNGYELYYQDPNDLSPIMEEVQRQFANKHAPGNTLDDALPPAEGIEQPVMHGTWDGLREDLLGRHEAPIVNGRYYGPGFYTTISKEIADAFGPNLYMVKGSKNGRTYKVLDIEGRLPDDLRNALVNDLQEWAARPDVQELARQHMVGVEFQRHIDDLLRGAEDPFGEPMLRRFVHSPLSSSNPTGALPYELQVDNWLADWLLDKGYGALRTEEFGAGRDVYVWLDPENLIVKPAYIDTDKWFSMEEWFATPDSAEKLYNRVPESRILREYRPDPQLRKLHASVEERLRKYGQSDPVYQALRAQEESLRQRLTPQLEAPRKPANEPVTLQDLPLAEAGDVHNSFVRRLYRRLTNPGKGTTVVKSADGHDVEYQQFFEGEGELMVPHVSASPVYRRLTDSYKRTLSRMQTRAVGYKRYLPPDVSPEALSKATGRKAAMEYLSEWADLVNDQIRNSPIYYKMLAGESDDAILSWLKNTDEGARIRRSQPSLGRNPEVWVQTHRQRLDFYIPDTGLQQLLAKRKLSPSDLSRVDGNLWPEVYGPDLMDTGGALAHARDKMYHALGTVPTDVLSRQPFARSMYDLKMKNLIGAADAEYLTPEVMLAYQRTARAYAVKQLRRTMFDLSEETNMTHSIRFMAPFWGAQQEAIVKWLNIIVDKPETVARFYLGMEGLYRNFVVIDEDGVEVDSAGNPLGYDPNHRVIIQIPENLKKMPVFDKALENFGSVGIPLGSANTVLQGDNPMLPSLGPIVTVPADWLATQMWDTYGTQYDENFFYRWLFPIGRPRGEGFLSRTMEQTFPGWGRRLKQISEGEDSITYTNTMFTVMREMQADHKKRGLPPPTPEEIQRATAWHYGLRTVASFGAPFSMEFRPNNQFFLDRYHEKLREVGPAKAFEEFYKEYGADATAYAASSSDGLIPPTAQGMAEWHQNKKLIQSLSELGYGDLAAAVISPDAWASEFSSDAYSQQFYIPIGPGSDKNLREAWSPAEREHETQRRVGWIAYRQFMAGLNAELYNMGLTSLEQSGAEELKAMKAAFVADQERSNPAWRKDYRDFSDTIYQQVDLMEQFAFEPRFDNRPDIQGLRQYLMIREKVGHALDAYAADTGGSRSLQSEENSEIRNYFYEQVGALIQANPAFGEFYSRFLDADRLERGSGP